MIFICNNLYISEEPRSIYGEIGNNYALSSSEDFYKPILLNLIANNIDELHKKSLPNEIISLYRLNFHRILEEIEIRQYKGPYVYLNDKFYKDIAVCSMKLIPV